MINKNILTFIVLSVIASALNYFLYPILSRILGSGEYVDITVSLSLFTQISTFLSSIIAITIGLSKDETDKNNHNTIEQLQAFLFKIFLIFSAAFLLFSTMIMNSLRTPILFAIPITLMMLLSIPISIISGYLNGKNLMISLGLMTLLSATNQFIFGLSTALMSRNGLATMFSMSLAQILTIALVYKLFSKKKLPKISQSLRTGVAAKMNGHLRSILTYTALASVAVVAISLVQVADLFIIKSLPHAGIKFYTDIYVISRIVFFAGMIFIWPFLGEIDINNLRLNRRPFLKLISYFTAITLIAILAMIMFGNTLTNILFGVNYDINSLRIVAVLSLLYKFFMLIITAVVLYFVVLRRYSALWLSFMASGIVVAYSWLVIVNQDMVTILLTLNALAGIMAILSIINLFHMRSDKHFG